MHTAGAALLRRPPSTLCDHPAQLLTGGFLDGGRNLFGLFDRLGLAGFFGDRFMVAVRKHLDGFCLVETEPAAHVLDGGGEPLHG